MLAPVQVISQPLSPPFFYNCNSGLKYGHIERECRLDVAAPPVSLHYVAASVWLRVFCFFFISDKGVGVLRNIRSGRYVREAFRTPS